MNALRIGSLILVMVVILVAFSWQPTIAAWSTNPSENTVVSGGVYNQDDPQIISDEAGGSIIAWRHVRSIVGTETDIYAQRLDAEGNELWIANGTAVCRETGNQTAPALVGDGAGGAVITWLDYRSGSTEIYAQRVDSSGDKLWGTDGVAVCTSGSLWEPEITSDGAGGAIICWLDSRSGGQWDIYAQRIDASGTAVWTVDGIVVCNAAFNQLDPQVISDGAGGAFISWQDPRSGTDDDIYCQRIDASGNALWTANGMGVCLLSGDQQYTSLAGDDNGGLYIGWQDQRSGDADMYVQHLDGSGSTLWTADGLAVCTAAGDQDNIALEGDGTGGVFVAWDDERAGSSENDIYAQRLDGNDMALWAADGIAVCTATDNQYEPRLAQDGYGGLILVWEDYRTGSGYDLYAQRIDQWGFLLWEADGVAVSMATNNQLAPVLIADGSGGVFIAWDDDRWGSSYDVYAQYVDFAGRQAGAAWSHDSFENNPVCTDSNAQDQLDMADDGSGGMIVTWRDDRSGTDYDIYAQRVGIAGNPLWPETGIGISTESYDQEEPQLVSDGEGGAIITWQGENVVTQKNIYAQRVDGSGTVLWTAGGVSICGTTGDQYSPLIVSDGAGGAIIIWIDYRSGGADVYGQRIDASGSVLWATNGLLICSSTDLNVISDGAGGAIIAWSEGTDIYAQRIDATGTPLWGGSGVAVCTYTYTQASPQLTGDDAGGAFIAWEHFSPNTGVDIYIERVNASGILSWGGGSGVDVCVHDENQFGIGMDGDGSGGVIIAWQDLRSTPAMSVYAQRINASGFHYWTYGGQFVSDSGEFYEPVEVIGHGNGGATLAWRALSLLYTTEVHAQRISGQGELLWSAGDVGVCTSPYAQQPPNLVLDNEGQANLIWVDARNGSLDIYAQRVSGNGYLGDPSPTIRSVIDYPDDQGGVTVLSCERSCYDEYPLQLITHYSVWSRLPDDPDRAGWTYVDDIPISYQDEYGFNAPTYEDYTGGPDFPLTEYKVIAHTSDPWTFWESGVRSGCSVDNLAPGAPLTLFGLPDEVDVLLTWEASGYNDEDLARYNVYRGSVPGFTADENTLIGTTIDIEFTDPSPGSGTFYYVVAGEDVHGNVGTPSNEAAVPLSTSTVAASLSCIPSSGILPFTTGFTVQFTNQYQGQIRRIAGRIHVTLANGTSYGSWRAGSTNIAAGSTYVTQWNQPIPALAPLVGDNLFRLVAADVTPAPYNQPPYPPAGDTDSDTEIVTGIAP